jgi:hypothetical protein
MLRILILLTAFMYALPARSVSWDAAKPGETVPDNHVQIGRFKVKLPSGDWFIAAKGSDRLSGWSGSAPVMLSLAVAQVDAGRVRGVLSIYTPAYSLSANWSDGACQVEQPLFIDKSRLTRVHPECVHILKGSPKGWWAADPKSYWGRVARQIQTYPAEIDDEGLYVTAFRSYRQDSLRLNVMVPGNFSAPISPSISDWALQVQEGVRRAVAGDSDVLELPPIPSP